MSADSTIHVAPSGGDDWPSLDTAARRLAESGGGVIRLDSGATYRLGRTLDLPSSVGFIRS